MTDYALAKLTAAIQALAEAKTLDEIKEIRSVGAALQEYARSRGLGLEAQTYGAEIMLRSDRRSGELLKNLPRDNPKHTFNVGKLAYITPVTLREALQETSTPRRNANRWMRIAGLSPESFEQYISERKAEHEELTTAGILRFAQTLQREQITSQKRSQAWPSGLYQVIYADPPWRYDNSGFDEAAEGQYPTMDLTDICELPVSSLSTNRSVLFLWATNPLLPEALQVLNAWGFTYKTNLAWIKDHGRGKGWFLKSKHELLLLGTRSETLHPKSRPDSCFEADRGPVHSRKPELAYQIIEQMYDGPRLELFARSQRAGWDVWGNESV